jgi:hypothetical protein
VSHLLESRREVRSLVEERRDMLCQWVPMVRNGFVGMIKLQIYSLPVPILATRHNLDIGVATI